MNRPLFPTTLSIPSYDIGKEVGLRTYQLPHLNEVTITLLVRGVVNKLILLYFRSLVGSTENMVDKIIKIPALKHNTKSKEMQLIFM
jgi:hypothetical protein